MGLEEQLGAQWFLLRGLAIVRAEIVVMATAFDLRVLWRVGTTSLWARPCSISATPITNEVDIELDHLSYS